MPPSNDRGRPVTLRTAPQASIATDTPILRPDIAGITELDALAAHVDGAFVVVVKVTGTDAKYRRRCYLTAKSAENAARKATERGENATVYLAELRPLWRLEGGVGRC